MSEENRFSNLMGGLKGGDKPVEKTAEVKPQKQKRTYKKREQKAPTAKDPDDPKIRRESSVQLAKSKDPDYEKGTYYLRKELTHEMRIYAATTKIEMSELVEFAVRQHLKKHPLK